MQALFVIIALAALVYFAAARRRYDLFSLAAVSALVYFTPGFAGVDLRGIPLEPEVYAAMGAVLLALVLYTAIADRASLRTGLHISFPAPGALLAVYGLAAVGVAAVILLRYGPAYTFGDKGGSSFPGWVYIAWRTTASLFLILAFVRRSRWLWVAVPLVGMLYLAGDRTGPALVVLGMAVAWTSEVDIRTAWRTILRTFPLLVLFAVLMLFGDFIFTTIRLWVAGVDLGQIRAVGERLDWVTVLRSSEPFVTQMVLNEIVRQSFYVGPGHLVGIFYQIWPTPSAFGYPSGIFNDLFQPVLFPESRSAAANWGVAYNFWGEALAAGGWGMFGAFLVVYLAGLSFFGRMIASSSGPIKALGAVMGAYWAFYIHRNSLANIITFERHFVYVAALCGLVAMLSPGARLVFGRVRLGSGPVVDEGERGT